MDDLIERLRAVEWEPSDDADRMPDDPALECVYVDMRPSAFSALLTEAADALEAAREDAERYRWLRDCDDGNIAAFYIDAAGAPDPASMLAGRQLDVDIDDAREARNG